jgi:hypothetical protein
MAEVRIIPGGTYFIEPTGADRSTGPFPAPEDVPQPNPPIPLEKFQAFAADFRDGDISPYEVFATAQANNGTYVIAPGPAPTGGTSLAIDMPANLDGATGILTTNLFLRQSRDSFKQRIQIEAISPEIMPIDGAAVCFVGLLNLFFNAGFAFIYSNATGVWSAFISAINNQVIVPLVPWTPGAKLEFTLEARLKGTSETCVHVTVTQNGVLVVDLSFTFPERFAFPLVPTVFLQASSSAAGPRRLEIVASQSVIGYQNLADSVASC